MPNNVSKRSPDSSPHATSHFWVCRAQGHTFEKKKNKNKPCCSLRREEGVEGCWGLSHERLPAVRAHFPAAAWHSPRWGFHLLSPWLLCTLFSVQELSISRLVLRALSDKTYLVKEERRSGLMPFQTQTHASPLRWRGGMLYHARHKWEQVGKARQWEDKVRSILGTQLLREDLLNLLPNVTGREYCRPPRCPDFNPQNPQICISQAKGLCKCGWGEGPWDSGLPRWTPCNHKSINIDMKGTRKAEEGQGTWAGLNLSLKALKMEGGGHDPRDASDL